MKSMISVKTWRIGMVFAALLLGAAVSALAQPLRYEGDVVSIDSKAHTFTVKGTERGGLTEMAFHVGPKSEIFVGTERTLLGELAKGDHVVVSYTTMGTVHTAQRAERLRAASEERTFIGTIVAVDVKAHMFTVKGTTGEKTEMMFHLNPSERLYFAGEQVPLNGLHKGDLVTVVYESKDTTHYAKHMKKTAIHIQPLVPGEPGHQHQQAPLQPRPQPQFPASASKLFLLAPDSRFRR